MFRAIDDFLIDRVFQPISDRLERWISCYGIAEFLMTGYIVEATVFRVFAEPKLVWHVPVFMFIGWGFFRRARKLDRSGPLDVIPAGRITELWVRMAWIASCLFLAVPLLLVGVGFFGGIDTATIFFAPAASEYFLACRRRPLKPKRSRAPANAAFEGAL